MKKIIVVPAALAVVLICLSVAVVRSNDHKSNAAAVKTSQVNALEAKVRQVQTIQTLHDRANIVNLKGATNQILSLKQQNATLCAQIKLHRLYQPLCNK